MKGLAPLFLGIFGTFVFSWVGLTLIPNWQIGHLNPQSDEEGTDIYPQPQSGMVERGARDYAANDIERKWGDRRSAPRDYIFDQPVFLGKMRMGQDLANIGARAPAEQQSPPPAGAATPTASPAQQGAAPAPSPVPPGASPSPVQQGGASAPSGSSPAAGSPSPATSPGSPPPKAPAAPTPKVPLASPSPSAIANAGPAASPSPTAAAMWPMETIGEPMYSA